MGDLEKVKVRALHRSTSITGSRSESENGEALKGYAKRQLMAVRVLPLLALALVTTVPLALALMALALVTAVSLAVPLLAVSLALALVPLALTLVTLVSEYG